MSKLREFPHKNSLDRKTKRVKFTQKEGDENEREIIIKIQTENENKTPWQDKLKGVHICVKIIAALIGIATILFPAFFISKGLKSAAAGEEHSPQTEIVDATDPTMLVSPMIEPVSEKIKKVKKSFIVLETHKDSGQFYSLTDAGEKTMKTYRFSEDNEQYLYSSGGVIFKGLFYIFGGRFKIKKIAVLDGCRFEELSMQLKYSHLHSNNLVTLKDDSKVLLCFSDENGFRKCQVFDGEKVISDNHSSNFGHENGCIGHFGEQILAVGGLSFGAEHKVEMRDKTGRWRNMPDLPKDFAEYDENHCIGFSDSFLAIGGWGEPQTQVLLFKENRWKLVGNMWKPNLMGYSLRLGKEIFTIGRESIDKFVFDEEKSISSMRVYPEIIFEEVQNGWGALLFDAKYDTCF